MQEALYNMLKEASVIQPEIELSGDKLTAILKHVASLPNAFISMNSNNK
jgi:hypothetical protein